MSITRALFGFPGGVRLPTHKHASTDSPIATLPVPPELVIPLSQHAGDPARATVSAGDTVHRGTIIGRAPGDFSAAVHASSSGTVTAVENRPVPHPSGLPEPCVVIRTDGHDTCPADGPEALTDWLSVSPARLRRRVADSGVTGLGGATFPAAVKLTPGPDTDVTLLVVNAIECEPWITCDDALLREHAMEVVTGARIMRHILGEPAVVIALEAEKRAALDALNRALDAAGETDMTVTPVPVRYPAGGEKQLIQTLTGREVPSGGLPLDLGILCHNAGTVAAVARAVEHGEPLTERIVTVAGTGVGQPRNFRVRLGTPVHRLIEAAGGYRGQGHRLIVGGPMMGFALEHDNVPVTKGCNCILVTEAHAVPPPEPALPCIRCGDCADACPVRLQPQQLYWHALGRDYESIREDGLFDCIECGACAYVCPSKLPLVGMYRHAKSAIRTADEDQRFAEQARQRYAFRQARLERERQEQAERRRRKKEALQSERGTAAKADRKAEIQAAVARARERKRGGGES
ncbi:electron transport complex subunit RsxC [Aquisalimonas asiatica]|uniref:Ion-translocating oxidoreductase complex subunit C n=1 Tax=Aquisalimonas asiatica TaxID=406100 RepID=A0A1H8RMH5_9GAMM|nr:electron transport complex subunit RsxC [Aquisalimonas asiatica]SEO67566.1 electron transport complex protein RnfC [Aquisalimonas asiatica]